MDAAGSTSRSPEPVLAESGTSQPESGDEASDASIAETNTSASDSDTTASESPSAVDTSESDSTPIEDAIAQLEGCQVTSTYEDSPRPASSPEKALDEFATVTQNYLDNARRSDYPEYKIAHYEALQEKLKTERKTKRKDATVAEFTFHADGSLTMVIVARRREDGWFASEVFAEMPAEVCTQ